MTTMGGAGVVGVPMLERVRAGVFSGSQGERVALEDVELQATLHDQLCEVRTTQVYRNAESRAIEAVYTFPLPLDAVLLDVHVTLGARELSGVVVEKATAEREYEAAVAGGDGAVMLEQAEPGLYTMNVGNLLPGEVARITVRYALLLRWSGNRLRLHFPTTIAPRYGASPLMPHQQPEQSLVVENRFSFSLTVTGTLTRGQFTCPSHALVQGRTEESLVLSLRAERASMDRDMVIELRAPHANRSVVLAGDDGDVTAAIASFQPEFGGLQQVPPLSLVLVVDCSGSMAGDAMAQASHALRSIVTQLQPHDQLGIVAFGSHTKRLRDRLAPCTPALLEHAVAFCTSLDADMGGTEIAQALGEAHRLLQTTERGEVFLITDGQVGGWEMVVERARQSGHRHFTVGVGSAVTEAFVRQLAQATGGASELVSPNEGMQERIVRHFERMRAPRATSVRVIWPEGATDVAPASFGAVFEGDTLVSCARLVRRVPEVEVVLEVSSENGETFRQVLRLAAGDGASVERVDSGAADGAVPHAAAVASRATYSTVARIAAVQRLPFLAPAQARALALRYQLASAYTNWLVIAERMAAEQAREMPALRKVPQTMAAGWGGMGSVRQRLSSRREYVMMPSAAMAQAPIVPDVPSPMRKSLDRGEPGDVRTQKLQDLSDRLEALLNADPSRLEPANVAALVREVVDGEGEEWTFDRFVQLTVADFASESDAATVLLAGLLRVVVLRQLTAIAQQSVDAFMQRARLLQAGDAGSARVQGEVDRVCRARLREWGVDC